MKLCKDCKHCELKALPPGKSYSSCNKLSTQQKVVICMNAREDKSECGPEAIHWEPK